MNGLAPLSGDLVDAGIGLRRVTEADVDFLRALYAAGRAAEMARVGWPPEMAAPFLADQFRLQHHHFIAHYADADDFIVTVHGAAVGRLLVDRRAPPWRLVELALAGPVQGRGWGGALVRWLQQETGSNGPGGLDLHVAFDNPRAEALYRRLGFQEVAHDSATHRRMIWSVS